MIFDDEYFESEMRVGFFVPAQMKQAWAATLEVLQAIDEVCIKHNIEYFADWGTLLATVRHQGFIPWDDDLDIVMKRPDYEKFLTVAYRDLPEGFELQNYETRDDHWMFLTRVINKGRICFEDDHLERYHQFPYIVSVDIFTLDYVCSDEEKEQERNQMAIKALALGDGLCEGTLALAAAESSILEVEKYSGVNINRALEGLEMRRQMYSVARKMFARFTDDESTELTQLFPFGLKNPNFRFPKEYYENSIRLPFENTTIPVPLYYEITLRRRYGDYMKLIKDWETHDYPYYQEQIDSLKMVLDFEMPEYRYSENQLRKNAIASSDCEIQPSYKELVAECIQGIMDLSQEVINQIDARAWGECFSTLEECQQLAIDLGTLIESVRGEGHICVKPLEEYCEVVYSVSEIIRSHVEGITMAGEAIEESTMQQIIRALEDSLNRISEIYDTHLFSRREVVFMPHKASQWDTMKSLWDEESAREDTDLYVVPMPYYYKRFDGSYINMSGETLENYPAEINAISYELFDLELHHPDVIYFQNPFDNWHVSTSVLTQYYSENLQKACEKLIYVHPYGNVEFTKESDIRSYINMKHYVTMPGVVRADEVIVPNDNMRELYIDKLCDFAGEDTREIWNEKIKVINLVNEATYNHVDETYKKKVAYYINASYFAQHRERGLEKMQRTFEIFDDNKEKIDVILCLHSKLKEATDIAAPELWGDFEHMLNQYRDADWLGEIISYTTAKDVINRADAFYGDGGFLALELSQIGKPVMIQNVEI